MDPDECDHIGLFKTNVLYAAENPLQFGFNEHILFTAPKKHSNESW